MANGNIYYVNSPVDGTHYGAPGGYWGIPANATSWQVQVKAYAGSNGAGGFHVVDTLVAMGSIAEGGAQQGIFTGTNANTTITSCSALNGSQVAQPWGWWASGAGGHGAPGSIGIEIINMTLGSWYIPSVTSFSPGNGGVGTSVTITGTKFHDATSVKFNGVSASFSVVSDTSITATVPSGATTGPISVGNQNGTGTSASNFVVAQGYARRSSIWTPGPVEAYRSTVWTQAQACQVDRSSVWTNAQ